MWDVQNTDLKVRFSVHINGTQCKAQCTVYRVQCSVRSVYYELNIVQRLTYTVYRVQYEVNIVYCTCNIIQVTVYSVQYASYSTVYIEQCTV